MINNKKPVNELAVKYFRCLYYTIILQMPKDIRLNSTHFRIMKIPNKRELEQTVLNHSSDTDFKDFI